MTLPVIVLGAGGHAKVVVDALLAAGVAVAGLVDPDPQLSGQDVLGVPVLGSDDVLCCYPADQVLLVCGVGSTGLPQRRKAVYDRFVAMGYRFATVIHPSAVVALDVEIEAGAQVMAGAIIQTGSRIGRNCIVNTRASIDHDCRIGDHVHVGPGVTLSGGVAVGADSHIGTGATSIQGISIGTGCLVGAGALVISDVLDGERVIGVPAKVVAR